MDKDAKQVNWKCPKGHVNEDFEPLPMNGLCEECNDDYPWFKVEFIEE